MAPKPTAGATSGRVLQSFELDGVTYKPNAHIFEGDAGQVAALHEAGQIDSHPDAVAYAEKAGHTVPEKPKDEKPAKEGK
jgi:hypothetical protein